jgi:hypothetical protein
LTLCSKSTRRPVRPQPLPDVFAGDDVAGPRQHQRQQLEGLLLQTHRIGAAAHLAQAHVDLDAAELHDRARWFLAHDSSSVAESIAGDQWGQGRIAPVSPRFTFVSPRWH